MWIAQGQGGLEWVETPIQGAEALTALVRWVKDHQERYVIGQKPSSDHTGSGGFGGSGAADFARDTKANLVRFDAENLAETYSSDWLAIVRRWTWPELLRVEPRWVFNVPDPEADAKIAAVQALATTGVEFKKNEVRGLTGLADPEQGDEVIGRPTVSRPTPLPASASPLSLPSSLPAGADPTQPPQARSGGDGAAAIPPPRATARTVNDYPLFRFRRRGG
jgi:hypothetical protein